MPKEKKARRFRGAKVPTVVTVVKEGKPQEQVKLTADGAVPTGDLSRGKKRRLARRAAFAQKLENVAEEARVSKAKMAASKNPLLHVGTLSDLLPDIPAPAAVAKPTMPTAASRAHQPKSHKARRAAMGKEVSRMAAVVAHPMFAANCLETLQQHLTATLTAEPAPPKQRRRGKKGAKKK